MTHAPQTLVAPPRRPRGRLILPAVAVLGLSSGIVAHLLGPEPAAPPGAAPPAQVPVATTYYVSPSGDDGNDGTSADRAWRTLARAERVGLRPGERLLLEGGSRFAGSVRIGPAEAGDRDRPVLIGSYGSGRATIEATGESGVTVYNTGGVQVRDLTIVGDAAAFATMAGVKLHADQPGSRFSGVVVSHVDVSGFQNGVEVGGVGGAGFRGVLVADSVLHGNRDAGLATYGPPFDPLAANYAHEDIRVRSVVAFDNRGDPANLDASTGNGIVLGSVSGGVVEDSVAHGNGALCASIYGPIGIWAYDSTRLVIQRNLAFRNRTGGRSDGGGYGLDNNVSGSVLQYNLSYENDGAGLLVFAQPGKANRDNVVRFNVSHDDARNSAYYAGVFLSGELRGTRVHHNTVVIGPAPGIAPAALKLDGDLRGLLVANNLLAAHDTGVLLGERAYTIEQVRLLGNDLYRAGQWRVSWAGAQYDDFARWRAASGQEQLDGRPLGFSVDPSFAGQGTVPDGQARAAYFALSPASVLLGAALDLRALFGVDPGPVDYFGDAVAGAIGAAQSPAS